MILRSIAAMLARLAIERLATLVHRVHLRLEATIDRINHWEVSA